MMVMHRVTHLHITTTATVLPDTITTLAFAAVASFDTTTMPERRTKPLL